MQKFARLFFGFLLILIFFVETAPTARADLVDDLKGKIDERNKVISDLEKEIVAYQSQVEKTGVQAKSLKNDIVSLELTRKKLSAEVKVIENKILATNLAINSLDVQIADTEATIKRTLAGIAVAIQKTDIEESSTLVEILLNNKSLSEFMDRVESYALLNRGLKQATLNLRVLKLSVETKKTETEGKKRDLQTLSSDLSDKKQVAEYNKAQSAKLLTATKSKQANYQKILDQKIAQKLAFERELLEYESQLKFAIDPRSLPQVGSGVLKWPLDSVKITQYFGNTDFAKAHLQLYNGQGHNGIDLKASVGTPVMSALSGKVVGAGNTDTVCPNASYGKWVLVEHPNGLSSLYAHLSVIKVSEGQDVGTGEVLGFSGETGYATGPHLHFTVYATQGVRIMTRKSSVCQGSYTMPVGSLNAYLNPLSYL